MAEYVKRVLVAVTLGAVPVPLLSVRAIAQGGEDIFRSSCLECHEQGTARAPSQMVLSGLSPKAVVAALEDGVMRAEGAELTTEQKIAVAEYVTGREHSGAMLPESAFCGLRGSPPDLGQISWMGFAGNLAGTGYQGGERAGITATDVPRLRLRWAFAFPDASQMRSSATVVGDVALVGGQFGEVIGLDLETGCTRWSFEAAASVRSAVLIAPRPRRDDDAEATPVAYFVDNLTYAYALDVGNGELLWKTKVGWHAASVTTGSPALFNGRLYVPISSIEVVTAGDPRYECCTSSGAVAALDPATGEVDWYHRVIPGYPEEVGKNGIGVTLWAPSGAPVWSSPTVDAERGLVYAGTGENYTRPTTATSDAILALDATTGELAWSFQATADDAFNMACTSFRYRQNCPDPAGPDHDFGMAPMLVRRDDGKDILVAGQKSGMVWALDPDRDGEVLWSVRVGKGGALGGIHWGMASDGRYAYATVSDRNAVIVDMAPEHEESPGLYAIDLMTGEVAWRAEVPEDSCEDRRACFRALSAAPTVIDGAVFAGGLDGWIRAYDTLDGSTLWEYDTAREHPVVGGGTGRGGAIDGPGPVVADGILFVNSGYGLFGQMPGNLLLAFDVGDAGAGRQ